MMVKSYIVINMPQYVSSLTEASKSNWNILLFDDYKTFYHQSKYC